MKFTIYCLFLFISISQVSAQNFGCCKDTLRQPDTFFPCYSQQYEPVCGCDQVTYRNRCAAEQWGGLINNGFCLGWTEGTICGNFDFDFIPSGITFQPVQFSLFMKIPGSATLYIYSMQGAVLFSDYFNASFPDQIITRQLDFQSLEIGIYLAIVVVNGEKQSKKFGKVVNTVQ